MSAPVAIVTGGSGSIGYGIATVLARDGFRVVLTARNLDRLERASGALAAETGQSAIAVAADTTVQDEVDGLAAAVAERYGRIDVLVNCAANPSGVVGPIEDVSAEQLLADFDTKVAGYVRCIKSVAPAMKERRFGRIVNIGGLTGRGSNTLSGMRNLAVTHLTKTLSDELGPHGITVNAVHPGIVMTPHLLELFEAQAAERGVTRAEVEAGFVADIPVRRILKPEEIGAVVAFLASSAGGSVTGESIAVDGGYTRGVYL